MSRVRDSSTSRSTSRPPQRSPAQIVDAGDAYGHNDSLAGLAVNMEFVSANPTGPLHLGHTRWAALGDAIARVLRASGAVVATEYYINDAGNQMDNFGLSILAAAKGEPTPEKGYPGAYIGELAKHVLESVPNLLELPLDEAVPLARDLGYLKQLEEIKDSLERFHVHFDVFFSERTLHAVDPATGRSLIDDAADRLRAQGHVFEADDAVWVRTTDFGDDKDRVLTRGNGVVTYFAADAAYYLSKKDRGFTEKIYLLGADHHGYVGRLKALAAAAGDDPNVNISVLIGQLVNLNGAKLSKRAGNIIELDDLLEWVGADALRYSLARYPGRFAAVARRRRSCARKTNDNPVFYVQYAHARTRSVARNAAAAGVDAVRLRLRRCCRTSPRPSCSARCRSFRASCSSRPSCASRIASPATSKRSPATTTAGTRRPVCCRSATSRSATCTAPGCG